MKYSKELMDAFAWTCFYQGYEEYLSRAINIIRKAKNNRASICCWNADEWGGFDTYIAKTLWSILVLMFGDYGIAPRVGWIDEEKYKDAIEFLRLVKNPSRWNL